MARRYAALWLMVAVLVASGAWAQPTYNEVQVMASDALSGNSFGYAVDIDGDRMVVGARGKGAVYFYHYDGSNWVEVAQVADASTPTFDGFGHSVAIDGDRAAVGAVFDDTQLDDSGAVLVYEWDGVAWNEVQKLTSSVPEKGEYFGWSVDIEGDRLIVGGPDNNVDDQVGAAYIFDYNGVSWVETQRIEASDPQNLNRFSYAVALDGDRVLVGAEGADTNAGAAYVFDYDGVNWNQTQKLTGSSTSPHDLFGTSVALEGDRVAVGARWEDVVSSDAGAVYVFEWDGVSWTETQRLDASPIESDAYLGFSLAMEGDRIVAGAPTDDDAASNGGAVHSFVYDGVSWSQESVHYASNAESEARFGFSVAMWGPRIAVSAHLADNGSSDEGTVYVFAPDGSRALGFDGAISNDADYVSVPYSAAFDLGSAMTLEAWVRWNGDTSQLIQVIMSRPSPNTSTGYRLGLYDGKPEMSVYVGGHNGITASDPIPANQWTHLAATFDGQFSKIYVNGALVVQGDLGSSAPMDTSTEPFFIGREFNPGSFNDRVFPGQIEEVRVWNAVRTQAEIAAAMSGPLVGNETGLVAYYDFNEGSGDIAVDGTGNGHHGALGAGVATREPSWVPMQTSLSVADITGTVGEVVSAPVQIGDTDGLGIIAFEFELAYDSSVLSGVSAQTAGTLSDGWTLEQNIVSGGGGTEILRVAAATAVSTLTGSGALVSINFTMPGVQVPAFSALDLEGVLINTGYPQIVAVADGSVTLVGHDGAIATDVNAVIPRESVLVTVTDADRDLDTQVPDQFGVTVTVRNSGSAITETEVLQVVETGNNTGVFAAAQTTVSALTVNQGDGIVQTQAGDSIEFLYDDALDASGNGPFNRIATVNVNGGADGAAFITAVTQPGDVIYLRVDDADLNTSFSTAETARVVVTSSNGETESVVLTEVDADDEVFFGTLVSAAGAAAGTDDDGAINAAKGDVLTLTYDDVVTALGDQVDRTGADQVVDPFGDADGNTSVQAFDAARILLHVLSPSLTGLEALQANVDIDPAGTGITPFDASLVLQKRVGLISVFPVQTASSTNHPQQVAASSKLVPETRWLALRAGEGYLSLVADERSSLLAGDLLLEGVERVELAPELGEYLLAAGPREEGLRAVFAGARGAEGAGEVLRLYAADLNKVRLHSAAFNDGQVQVQIEEGAAFARPQVTALHANAPNPFNPETSIRFDLAQGAEVELVVFDALGQKIKTLVTGHLPAGVHNALWRGVNEAGQQVGSGAYFYRLRAGDYSQVQRMLLVK